MYQVKVQQFEGPFEMLIELIEQKQLSINEVSLAGITDQYLNYLKQIERFPLKEVAAFIVVAATLMLIKSRSLIPSLKLTEEEEVEIKDLETQLKLYKQFRSISREVEKIFGKRIIFAREAFLNLDPVFIKPGDLRITNLKNALEQMLKSFPQKEILPQTVVKKTVTLEEKIDNLINRLQKRVSLCFSELESGPECKKVDLIVSFLALLELIKRGLVTVKQTETFGKIEMTPKNHTT